jgi:hypothetical protein
MFLLFNIIFIPFFNFYELYDAYYKDYKNTHYLNIYIFLTINELQKK